MVNHTPPRKHGVGNPNPLEGAEAIPGWEEMQQSGGESIWRTKEQIEPGLEKKHHLVVESSHKDALKAAVTSLLIQFSNTQVRGDFLGGEFEIKDTADTLSGLDELRCVLLPRWRKGSLIGQPRSAEAVRHFDCLVSRSSKTAVTKEGNTEKLSYGDWFALLEKIAVDPYWSRLPSSERCTHTIGSTDPLLSGPLQAGGVSSGAIPKRSSGSKKDVKPKTRVISSLKCNVKSNDRTISDTGSNISDTNSDSSICDESSSSDGSYDSGSSRSSTRRTRRRRRFDERSVVKPPVFEVDGKTSLKSFLQTFERFFKNQFRGDNYDKTQTLSNFLSGDLLKVYKVRGGRKLKYPEMKEELLEYYKKQKIGTKRYWRNQLSSVALEMGEDYDLFALRVTELAKLGYPKDRKEQASQIRETFLKNLPPGVTTKITDAERAHKAITGGRRRHLPMSSIIEIAKDVQSSQDNPRSILWTSEALKPDRVKPFYLPTSEKRPHQVGGAGSKVHFRREIEQPRSQHHRKGSSGDMQRNLTCFYCKRRGHKKTDCWRAANKCLICGGNHNMKECPSYNPRHRSLSNRRQNFQRNSDDNEHLN